MPVKSITTDMDALTIAAVAEVAAPVERVWNAYVNPRQLERFWGPPGWPATFTQFDFTVGGKAFYTMTGPRGESASIGGEVVSASWEFTAINPPHCFEVIDSFVGDDGVPLEGGQSRIVFEFERWEGGTRVTSTGHFASLASLEQVVELGVIEGTRMAMSQLDAVVQNVRDYAFGKGAQLELLDETHVRITRLVEGPRDLVWRAYMEPTLMRKWLLGPDGWQMTENVPATAVGETYRESWAPVGDTPGEPFGFEGEVLLLDAPRRAVMTQRLQGSDGPTTMVDLNLYEEDGATLITVLIEYPDLETRDMILATGMVDGMESSYARLQQEILG